MFYGPNGSGKTSLCEALELALLGSVDGASAKRIPPQRYFANLHENRFETPLLTARGAQGQELAVMADSKAYRFCFIEKNRIDNFSRIAAKTAGEKKDLIASLFGMEQFLDFVGYFNESMDGQLSLIATWQQQLAARRWPPKQSRARRPLMRKRSRLACRMLSFLPFSAVTRRRAASITSTNNWTARRRAYMALVAPN